MSLEKSYNPQGFEKEIYKNWEEKGYFTPKIDKNKPSFSIMMPPPNITGQLHIGHALDNALQDSIIRYKRMSGFNTLWVPGTDHASIATEVKIVDMLAKEGITKEDLGREGFLKRAWEWKEQYGGRIVEQLKTIGSSCDWSRLAFTMDDNLSEAVKEAFVRYYNEGLIYRGSRIINWCPDCKTALSDAEVEYEEQDSFFWHIRYPIKDGSGYVTVATTRPETMLGDTAVAVNPDDERYKDLVGKMLILPFVNKEIPVIADAYVDKEFGTGCVKITPAHDPNDFEVGLRHNLAVIRVMNDDGTMNSLAGKYEGLSRYEAREKIVAELKEQGFLVKIEPHKHNVGTCYRCHSAVEPIVSKQWFVKMEPLAKPAIEAIRNGDAGFIPKRYENTYFSWMENIRDWCISRQLWWGHRIPAYYCDECGEMVVAKEMPDKCPKCGGTHFKQDEDVLDTWFSSALWPFSTLGYPRQTEDLKTFYPTSALVTAYDIIFFWVARMMFSGLHFMGEVPFKDILIHGLVRDAEGRKMSKSLGNGIDPIEVIDNYGADALRFALMNGTAMGSDQRFTPEKLDSARNFMNKIWNATRFALMNFEGKDVTKFDLQKGMLADKWIVTRANEVAKTVANAMERYDISIALGALYDFVWSDLCDWYIELIKPVLYGDNNADKQNTLGILNYVLAKTLKMLHPFIPFITEKLYDELPNAAETIMLEDYPVYDESEIFAGELEEVEKLMDMIKSVRNLRSDMDIAPSRRSMLHILPNDEKSLATLKDGEVYIEKLAYGTGVTYIKSRSEVSETAVSAASVLGLCFIEPGDLVDKEKEIARLTEEKAKYQKEIDFCDSKLNNSGFMDKAPDKLKESIRDKRQMNADKLQKVLDSLAKYQQ